MDLRPKEGPKMQPAQHINTKEHKTTANLADNMNNSRSERRYSKSAPDFDYYVAKKFNSKSEKERDLYFQKLLEAFRTLSEEAPEVFDPIAPEILTSSPLTPSGSSTSALTSAKGNPHSVPLIGQERIP